MRNAVILGAFVLEFFPGVLKQCLLMARMSLLPGKLAWSGAHGILPWLSWLTLVPLLLSTM